MSPSAKNEADGPPPLSAETIGFIPAALLLVDGKGRIRAANDRAARLLGVPKQALIGPWTQVFVTGARGGENAPATRPPWASIVGDDAAGFTCELEIAGDPRTFRLEAGAPAPLATDGTVAVVRLEDITRVKELERALARRDSDATLLAEASRAMDASLDLETIRGAIVRLGVPRLGEAAGIDISEEIGDLVPAVLTWPRAPLPSAFAAWRAAAVHDDRVLAVGIDAAGDASDPHALVISLRARGRTLGTLVFWRTDQGPYGADDIALGKEWGRRAALLVESACLFREALAIRRDMEVSDGARNEFVARVSHELRTPLAAIFMWTHVLRQGHAHEVGAAIDAIEISARAQSRIIEDLSDVLRGIRGRLRLNVARCDLGTVVAEAVAEHGPHAIARGLALTFSPAIGALPVMGDADRLRQIASHLLSNALKFTPPGGRVSVALERRDERAVLRVADTGRGLRPEQLTDIFTPFRSGHDVARSGAGLGLGLVLARQLVELHGGSIEIESAGPDRGSTFWVLVPLVETPAEASTGIRDASGPPPGAAFDRGFLGEALKGARVLLIEDDATTRRGFSALLARAGATVAEAGTLADAHAILTAGAQPGDQTIDAMVSDILLPDGTAHDIVARLRRSTDQRLSGLPAIAVTAVTDEADRQGAIFAGFDDLFPKPVDMGALVHALGRLIAARKR